MKEELVLAVQGIFHSLALTNEGRIFVWGREAERLKGSSPNGGINQIFVLKGKEGRIIGMAAGAHHNLFLTDTGDIFSWGGNTHGQLGDGTNIDRGNPAKIGNLSGSAKGISAGLVHSLAFTKKGALLSWGADNRRKGETGVFERNTIPTPVDEIKERICAVACGMFHSIALTTEGKIYFWGEEYRKNKNILEPRKMVSPSILSIAEKIVAVASGDYHCLGLSETGQLYGWGSNRRGQLGNYGSEIRQITKIDLGIRERVTKIAAGATFSLALTESEKLIAWGDNVDSQLLADKYQGNIMPTVLSEFPPKFNKILFPPGGKSIAPKAVEKLYRKLVTREILL